MAADRAVWRKSSRSGQDSNCVELRQVGDVVEIRDSKDRGGPVLRFTPKELSAFVGGAQDGEFDDLV